MRFFILVSLGLISLKGNSHATPPVPELRITEFVAKNDEGLEDSQGDRHDWIELWNASGVSGDPEGWFLTDDPANLTKWQLPSVSIPAGGRLIVFASGEDRVESNSDLHTNFRLQSEAGGYLALVRPDGVTLASEFRNYPEQQGDIAYGVVFPSSTQVRLLEEGETAKWLVPTGEIAGWTEANFDDSQWASGATGIGYDTSTDYDSHLGAGDDLAAAMRNVNQSVFIRIPFTASPALGNDSFLLRMKWEDGFAAFLNGREITRQRAPEVLSWNSGSEPANGRNESDAVTYFDYEIPEADLVEGTNILAIQGLNQSINSSDLLVSPLIEASERSLGSFETVYFLEATPGRLNSENTVEGLVGDTKFNVDRGTKTEAFDLAITTSTPDATIRYTTDGSEPSETRGLVYNGPIRIERTTIIRAMAYQAGYRSTNVDTQSYIFPADVIIQPTLRTAITGHPVWGPQLLDSINSLPTISLSMEEDDINRVELPVSVELLNFEHGNFQVDAGAVRYGGLFADYAKHSVRLHFRSIYGPKRLRYPVFDSDQVTIPTSVDSFDALDLRAGNQDMVHRGAYLSNRFADESMLDMGQLAPHGRYVHIYFNGNYRGVYYVRERFHSTMLANYYPGNDEEYTTITADNIPGNRFGQGSIQNGDFTDWANYLDDLRGSTPFRSIQSSINVTNLIDFMLLWTSGSCESEFRAVGSLSNNIPYIYHMKDADGFLRPPDLIDNDPRNRTFAFVHLVNHNGPSDAWTRLLGENDPDFKILLADRIYEHFLRHDGALTPERHIARLQRLVDGYRLPYLMETARWGVLDGDTPNRNPTQWEAYHTDVLENQFPELASSQVAKFRAAGMYPNTDAPSFIPPGGGSISPDSGVVMSTSAPRIYYTLDGSDPRLPGGAINPVAQLASFDPEADGTQEFIVSGTPWRYLDDGSDQGIAWRTSNFDDSLWEQGPSELGYGESDEETRVGFVDVDPSTPGNQRNATTYFRTKFNVTNPNQFVEFILELKYDDAAAIYLNGNEVVRTENLPASASFDTYASGNSPDENQYFPFIVSPQDFVEGENSLAVEIHNASPTSGDLSFDLRLSGLTSFGADQVTFPISLNEPATINARSFDNAINEWSALNSAFFSLDSVPASSDNIVISEIHYHPAEPTTPEEIAISTNQDDFEFIELLNISSQPVEMSGVQFTDGIDYIFPDNFILDARQRLVVARNLEAFSARYISGIQLVGPYAGRLSNGGEQVDLRAADGEIIVTFTYDDAKPWPVEADGGGPSLYLSNLEESSLPSSWTLHTRSGGAPGNPDQAFALWKYENNIITDLEDNDADDIPAILEYFLGTSPDTPSQQFLPDPRIRLVGGVRYLELQFASEPRTEGIQAEIQISTDLKTWNPAIYSQVEPESFRIDTPMGEGSQFLRISVTSQQN